MSGKNGSRRDFLGAAVAAPALGAMALADPGRAAAQSAGVKRGDLPDLGRTRTNSASIRMVTCSRRRNPGWAIRSTAMRSTKS